MLVLLFITPVFERVPYNAMGAIVLSSVIGLLEIAEARFLFKANFLDFLVWMAAFLGTLFLGVEIGLGIAIGLAVVLVVYQSAFPHTAVLGNLPETGGRPSPSLLRSRREALWIRPDLFALVNATSGQVESLYVWLCMPHISPVWSAF